MENIHIIKGNNQLRDNITQFSSINHKANFLSLSQLVPNSEVVVEMLFPGPKTPTVEQSHCVTETPNFKKSITIFSIGIFNTHIVQK